MSLVSLRRCALFLVAAGAIGGFVVHGSHAQPEQPPAEETTTEEGEAIERIDAAYQMIDLGRRLSSPEALLAAAKILHANPPKELKESVEDAEKAEPVKLADLLKEAKGMRPKDKALADYIAKLADDFKEDSRGSLNFRGGTFAIAASKTAKFTIVYKGKAPAMVRVSPGGSVPVTRYRLVAKKVGTKTVTTKVPYQVPTTPLFNVKLTDAKGKVLYTRNGSPSHAPATFVPAQTGPYHLYVTNVNSATARAVVTSN